MIYVTANNSEQVFAEAAYPLETEPDIFAKRRLFLGEQRDTLRLTLAGSYAGISAAFVDGACFGRETMEAAVGADGQPTGAVLPQRYDLSAYSKAGDIVDHRDGKITVYMGKPTELELTQTALDEMVLAALGGV
ncbi:MAG: hypothetical protein RR387_03575 [Clostridiales bacterium]